MYKSITSPGHKFPPLQFHGANCEAAPGIKINTQFLKCSNFRDFGHKAIGIKPIVKQIQKLLEDRDKNVREETKLMVIEMYRWVGAALKPQLANLKPVQVNTTRSNEKSVEKIFAWFKNC